MSPVAAPAQYKTSYVPLCITSQTLRPLGGDRVPANPILKKAEDLLKTAEADIVRPFLSQLHLGPGTLESRFKESSFLFGAYRLVWAALFLDSCGEIRFKSRCMEAASEITHSFPKHGVRWGIDPTMSRGVFDRFFGASLNLVQLEPRISNDNVEALIPVITSIGSVDFGLTALGAVFDDEVQTNADVVRQTFALTTESIDIFDREVQRLGAGLVYNILEVDCRQESDTQLELSQRPDYSRDGMSEFVGSLRSDTVETDFELDDEQKRRMM